MSGYDDDEGGVRNDPDNEFAFEVSKGFTVAEIEDMTDAVAEKSIRLVDDQGAEVTTVPIGLTSRQLLFGFADRFVTLPEAADSLPGWMFIQLITRIVATKMLADRAAFKVFCPAKTVLNLAVYRFYFAKDDGCWTITFIPKEDFD